MPIITKDAITVYTEGEPTIHIEHFFDIGMLEGLGLNIQHTLMYCGIHGYFNDPEFIEMFWRNAQLKDWKTIVSKVLGKEVVLSMDFIAQVIGCIREGSTYQEDWEKPYECHVLKALYDRNLKETDGKKKIQYNLLYDMAKFWSNVTLKSFMHKIGFKDFVFDL